MIDFDAAIQTTLTRLNDEHNHTELDPYTFHPSQLAKCPRQCYAAKLGLLDNTDSYGTLHMGTTIHEFMEAEVIPDLDVETRREVPIKMDIDGLRIVGHADLYEPGDGIVYDYKSRANWYKFSPPIQRHLNQVYLYMQALGAPRGQIVYLAKADLEVRTWPPQSAGIDTVGLDTGRVQDLIAKGKRIAATIIDQGYPAGPEEIPFEQDDCWFCSQESLQFDHLQSDVDIDPGTTGLDMTGTGTNTDIYTTQDTDTADKSDLSPDDDAGEHDGTDDDPATSTA